MSTKETILNFLETEINKLVIPYEEKIKSHEKEILHLTDIVNQLKIKNNLLQKELLNASFAQESDRDYDLPVCKIEQSSQERYEKIDELDMSTSVDEGVLLLAACEQALNQFDTKKFTLIFDRFVTNPEVLMYESEEVAKLFLDLFKKILLEDTLRENEFDQVISGIIDFVIEMKSAPFQSKIIDILKENQGKIFDSILERNEPFIIAKYLRMILAYGLKEDVRKALKHILDIEWGFIDSSLSKADFTFFLWYSYLFDLDKDLIDRASVSLQWFNENFNDQALYFYYHDETTKDKDIYKTKVDQFNCGKVLAIFERGLVLQKMNLKMKPLFTKQSKPLLVNRFNRTLNAVSAKDLSYFIEKHSLIKQKITLPLYKNQKGTVIRKYITVDNIYYSPAKIEAFIIHEELERLRVMYSPLFIKSRSFNGVIISDMANTNKKNDSFSWPSTEINEAKINSNSEEKTLNEKSALKLMGYQISGLTRAGRWGILEKAVPRLGLKKIAYTISYNVKLRKGQQNGHQKFSHAISEWEHDLEKLKKHYYKKDFNWPNT